NAAGLRSCPHQHGCGRGRRHSGSGAWHPGLRARGVSGSRIRAGRLAGPPADGRCGNRGGDRVARRRALHLRSGSRGQQRRARHRERLGPRVSRSVTDAARQAPRPEGVRRVTRPAVEVAMERIRPWVRRTPLEFSPALSEQVRAEVHFKMECWQVTGSFKPRISFSKLLSLDPTERKRGAIASTAGGHGIGLSYAAQQLGVPAHIYLPHSADPAKVAVMRRLGARLTFFDSVADARVAARAEAEHNGLTFVSAYNDPAIICGGGTVGLEIGKELPGVCTLVTGIGGGGLITGSAIAMANHLSPPAIWGVQP